MEPSTFDIGHIPAILYGPPARGVYLFIHGKNGCKEEGEAFAGTVCPKGWQVLAIDLPEHGSRKAETGFDPWHAVPELRTVLTWAQTRWDRIALRANSLGAWFSLLAFQGTPLAACLLVSPVLDMARLIETMMTWAGITREVLQQREHVETSFGETLSWPYYEYALAHPVRRWTSPTAILYAGGDALTSRETVDAFVSSFSCDLMVLEDGEHWFHTPEQLSFLTRWEADHTQPLRDAIEVVAALIQDGKGRFLACQRPPHKSRGLQWEFAGGKMEPGETKAQALIREVREELGIAIAAEAPCLDVTYDYPDVTVHLSLLPAAITDGTPQKLEHHDIRWMTLAESGNYDFCPADRFFLERLRQHTPLQEQLLAIREPGYRAFQCTLMPTVDPETVIGVRTPDLRKLAASLAKSPEIEAFLADLPHRYYEENNLHGILLSAMKDYDQVTAALDTFLPYVDNWATCDLIRPKVFRHHLPELLPKIREWMASAHPYTVRFGMEMLMCWYLDKAFQPEHLDWVAAVRSGEYYVNMMTAWYFATALAKQYDAAVPYLEQRRLDPWTHNKAIQKAIESYRITDAQKAYLGTLKVDVSPEGRGKARRIEKTPGIRAEIQEESL